MFLHNEREQQSWTNLDKNMIILDQDNLKENLEHIQSLIKKNLIMWMWKEQDFFLLSDALKTYTEPVWGGEGGGGRIVGRKHSRGLNRRRKIPHTGNTRPSRTWVIKEYRYYTISLIKYYGWCQYHKPMSIGSNTLKKCQERSRTVNLVLTEQNRAARQSQQT